MAIAYVTTANTFQQWLISTQDLITTANNLTDGGNTKTFYANTNVVVGNNLTVVGNTAITGNTTITGDLTVTGNITLDSLGPRSVGVLCTIFSFTSPSAMVIALHSTHRPSFRASTGTDEPDLDDVGALGVDRAVEETRCKSTGSGRGDKFPSPKVA